MLKLEVSNSNLEYGSQPFLRGHIFTNSSADRDRSISMLDLQFALKEGSVLRY